MMGQTFIECPYVFMMAGEIEFENPSLRALPTESVQSRIDSLVMFNQYLLKSLPFLYFEEGLIHEDSKGETVLQTQSLTACFILGKKFALESINTSYLKTVSDGLPTDYSNPTIDIDTSKLKKWYSENKCDTKGDHTMFGHVFKKLKEENLKNLRIQSSTNYAWTMNYSNEGEQTDVKYRKSLCQIVEELQSSYLPLFIPSINNKDKDGEFQDAWVINPSCLSQLHLQMYKFIGAMIAMSFRAGFALDFKFSPLFWKKFLYDPLKLEDLAHIDNKLYQTLKQLASKEESKQSAIPLQKIAFTTELSDGTFVKLTEEGDDEYVNEENSQQYIDLVLSARFQESKKQMDAIKAGFEVVFPSEVARVLDWEDVEKRVCGSKLDVEKLKTITDYVGLTADDEWGTYFWNIIKNLSPEMQSRYLRSAVGRTRLPLEPRFSETRQIVNLKDAYTYTDHDQQEVLFNTETFSIHLPRYTTEEIMKKNILKAISKTERYYHWGTYKEAAGAAGNDNITPTILSGSNYTGSGKYILIA
jgi:E3 ubiquitin-protein ligase HERC2